MYHVAVSSAWTSWCSKGSLNHLKLPFARIGGAGTFKTPTAIVLKSSVLSSLILTVAIDASLGGAFVLLEVAVVVQVKRWLKVPGSAKQS